MLSPSTNQRLSVIDRDLIERRIKSLWDCRARGDIDALAEYLAPDCVHMVTSWFGEPVMVRREGRDACQEIARQIHVLFETVDAVVTEFVIDGDQAAASRKVTVRNRGAGRTVDLNICYFFRFRDGWLVEICERTDTLGMSRLFGD